MPTKKKKSISKLKEEAWKFFSLHIRTKYCLLTTGSKTRGKCYTCNKVYQFAELQAGHFLDGRNKAVLFLEDAVRIQCRGCNLFKSGNKDAYTLHMIEEVGNKKVKELLELKKKSLGNTDPWKADELIAIKNYYKETYEVEFGNN